MKKLIALLILTGCIGVAEPANPIDRLPGDNQPSWTEKQDEALKEKFNRKIYKKDKDWTDPWRDFEQPDLFPPDWEFKGEEKKYEGKVI